MTAWRLYLNVGNSSAQIGVWADGRWQRVVHVPADDPETALGNLALPKDTLEATAACFSRPQPERWLAAVENVFGWRPPVLGRDFAAKISTCYTDPRQLGPDRAANVLAAVAAGDAPCIILDGGTCLTADLVDANGLHLGGAIAPGLPAARAGILAAAPHLEPSLPLLPPRPVPAGAGVDTGENLALGLVLALAGTAQALVDHLQQMTESPAQVILTGGDAGLLAERLKGPAEVRSELTLDGLRLAHEATGGP